jgi:predicted porin
MKNFRLFLALASCFGMPGIAHAQSNVTVYGNADASFDVITVHGQPTAPALRFQRVSTNGSVLGFKGAEALGSDLKAVFQFESNVSFDAGGSIGTSRSSFVGLSGPLGKVIMGRFAGPARSLAITLDVNYDRQYRQRQRPHGQAGWRIGHQPWRALGGNLIAL